MLIRQSLSGGCKRERKSLEGYNTAIFAPKFSKIRGVSCCIDTTQTVDVQATMERVLLRYTAV